jgi:acylphosphatase
MTGDLRAIHCVVRGRVQGVGFRSYARGAATGLGISGWVRNSVDPREVELRAQGTNGALDAFRQRLAAGPREAQVESVRCEEVDSSEDLAGFEIRR